jgi:hypothetical protein
VIGYLERVADRQINKARGILTVNIFLIGINGFVYSILHSSKAWEVSMILMFKNLDRYIFIGLAISALLMFEMLWVRWMVPEAYGSFSREITETAKVLRKRTFILNVALWVSVLCVLGMSIIVLNVPPSFKTS